MKKSVLPLLTSSLAHPCAKPHPYHSVNHPSRGNLCSLAMQQLLHRVVAIFLLLMVCAGAWGADYVFMSGSNYIIINNSGAITTTTTFNPSTCLWSGTSGGSFTNNGRTLKYSQTYSESGGLAPTRTYNPPVLSTNTSETSVSIDVSSDGTISFEAPVRASRFITWNIEDGTWYIQYYDSNVVASTTSSSANNIKAYEYTTLPATVDAPTITGAQTSFSEVAENHQFSHGNSIYRPTYGEFSTGSANYYWYESALHDVAPSPTSGFTYTWSLSSNVSGYASVDNGKVTYTALVPEPTVNAELICTATHTSGATAIATYPLTFTNDGVLAKPTIEITPNGTTATVTITGEEGTTIYYTTDGSEPSATSSQGTSPVTLTNVANQTVIKAFAKKDGYSNSIVAVNQFVTSGVSSGKVILNDYEDHRWTYYAGVDESVDGGNYNTNYAGKMYSPDPRNVKITYQANGGQVSISESETEFVYYKTIEKVNNAYKYQVISNPFSKRPTGKGFGGWKLKSITTGASISGHSTTSNETLALDEELTLTLPDAGINGTSAEIVFEATWVDANVTTITSNPTSAQDYSFTGGTYETNFIVLKNVNYTRTMTINSPCTIMMVEPDGSADYRSSNTFSGNITPNNNGVTKIENATWNPSGNIAAGGKSLWIGRGVVTLGGTTVRAVVAAGANVVNQVVKIESGNYTTFTHYNNNPSSGFVRQWVIYGCDYDRAKNDNSKLSFSGICIVGNNRSFGNVGQDQELCRIYSKSGTISNLSDFGTANYSSSYYVSGYGNTRPRGKRYVEIEGGDWKCNIAGGQDVQTGIDNTIAFKLRMKGGRVRGAIYTGAQQNAISGSRVVCITGGQIGGWISGGVNGLTSGGTTAGTSYVYVGGNAEVDSKYQNDALTTSNTTINNSIGGYIYGAGCGYSASARAGEMTYGTNVVFADNAIVEHGVYGGGGYGYTPATANVYVTGGHVKSLYDPTYSVFGGVYGGARQNDGGYANVYMTGGQIDGVTNSGNHGGGLFGGSNASGTIDNSVKMVITGGQVGTTTQTANIHGGGYGSSTTVSQNVDITLGLIDSEPDADGVTVYGDVYGGSALGSVNGNAATNTYHTNVTLNAGTINGSLYGGALGNSTTAANVYGPVQVKVYGGSVMNTDGTGANGSGAVYGANNINGAPQRAVTVDIYGTDSASAEGKYALYSVYGGGNAANYTYGNGYPKVTVHNCDNSIEYVYGGGNAAAVAATDVTIYGGNKIGNVFGGGNGQVTAANVTGNTSVKIYGGTIGDVYGGSNTNGTIGGTISVNVNAQAEDGHDACQVNIDNVYGGGNKAASNVGSITIGCAEHIGAVYGGANQANITGNIDLKIESGHIDNVFGGNNNSGTISGTIKVTVDDKGRTCGMLVGNVYGGGNKAAYGSSATSNYPEVNIVKGHLTGNVFGGGLGATAVVTGNPQVNIGDWRNGEVHAQIDGSVFGGGDAAAVEGNPSLTIRDCKTIIVKDVYGGGNAAPVYSTNLTIWGGSIGGNVFGGGNGERGADYAANVGYDRNNTVSSTASGNAVTNIYGGTFGVWNGDECTSGGGIFGGSNSHGNIKGEVQLRLDAINFTDAEKSKGATGGKECTLKLKEAYGAGNKATFTGSGIKFSLGCVGALDEIYGGAKEADMTGDIHLKITSGQFKRVFGGNNLGGKIYGSIKVTVDETGCHPVIIDELYGCGHDAPYNVAWQTTATKVDPVVNIVSCTHIGQVFGGGLGATAIVTGNPTVNINQIKGEHAEDAEVASYVDSQKLGSIDNVYGGGNAAKVVGDTHVNIGTLTTVKRADETQEDATVEGVNISGNVYGGGNQADVTGKTHVQVGPTPSN